MQSRTGFRCLVTPVSLMRAYQGAIMNLALRVNNIISSINHSDSQSDLQYCFNDHASLDHGAIFDDGGQIFLPLLCRDSKSSW